MRDFDDYDDCDEGDDDSTWSGGYRTYHSKNDNFGCCWECGADTKVNGEPAERCPECGSDDIDDATSTSYEREDFRSDC